MKEFINEVRDHLNEAEKLHKSLSESWSMVEKARASEAKAWRIRELTDDAVEISDKLEALLDRAPRQLPY